MLTLNMEKVTIIPVIKFKNLLAVQFHPELSGKVGLKIFNLFLNKF